MMRAILERARAAARVCPSVYRNRLSRVAQVAQEAPAVRHLDQARAHLIEREAHGSFQLVRRPRAPGRDSEGGGELKEVRVVQVGVEVALLIFTLLDVPDRTVA